MRETHCLLCYGPLEVRDVAPCEICGAAPSEIEHFHSGKHTYAEYEVFPDLNLVLCNVCVLDLGSYAPTSFGLSPQEGIGYETVHFLRDLADPAIEKDKYCPSCNCRLAYLRFVSRARDVNAKT